jgi:hypothetical protein
MYLVQASTPFAALRRAGETHLFTIVCANFRLSAPEVNMTMVTILAERITSYPFSGDGGDGSTLGRWT